MEQGLPCLTCTHSSGQVPQELPGEQLCLGTQPPKFPKPLPSLQNDSTAAAQKDFQEITELTVLSSVPSTRELLLRIEKENPNPTQPPPPPPARGTEQPASSWGSCEMLQLPNKLEVHKSTHSMLATAGR